MEHSTRQLRTLDAVSLTVGSMVGAGIFSVLALTIQTAGASAVLSWVLVVVLSLPMVFTFSGLVGVLGQSGGPYIYIRDKSVPWLGLWTAWLFFVSAAGAAMALFIALVGMLRELGAPVPFLAGTLLLLGLTATTAAGIHLGAHVQRILTLGTIALLVLCAVIGLSHMGHLPSLHTSAAMSRFAPHGWSAIMPATFFAFWTYSGWEAVAVPSGAYRSRRALAVGMITGSLLVGVLYILVAFSAVSSVPADALAGHTNPLVLVGKLWGTGAGAVIGWGALVVVVGSLLSWLIATTSLVQAMARDGLMPFPKRWTRHPGEYHPAVPWVVSALLAAGACLPVFGPAVAASSLTALIGYAVVFTVVLFDTTSWEDGNHKSRRKFLSFLSLGMTLLLIAFSGWHNMWPTAVLCVIGVVFVWARRSHWRQPSAVHIMR